MRRSVRCVHNLRENELITKDTHNFLNKQKEYKEDTREFTDWPSSKLIKIFQQAHYWPTYLLIKTLFFYHVEGLDNLRGLEEKPVIFASNHANYIDSPIVGAAMPRDSLVPKRFFPLRFLAAEEYCSWKKSPFPFPSSILTATYVKINGSIPVVKGLGDLQRSLSVAIKILQKGNKLWIYPEGRFTRDGRLQPGKKGVAYLHKATGAPVVPVGLSGTYKIISYKNLFKRKVQVRFGKPIYSFDNLGLEETTQKIMAEIAMLIS